VVRGLEKVAEKLFVLKKNDSPKNKGRLPVFPTARPGLAFGG